MKERRVANEKHVEGKKKEKGGGEWESKKIQMEGWKFFKKRPKGL